MTGEAACLIGKEEKKEIHWWKIEGDIYLPELF
jgi:hypothetical protein